MPTSPARAVRIAAESPPTAPPARGMATPAATSARFRDEAPERPGRYAVARSGRPGGWGGRGCSGGGRRRGGGRRDRGRRRRRRRGGRRRNGRRRGHRGGGQDQGGERGGDGADPSQRSICMSGRHRGDGDVLAL